MLVKIKNNRAIICEDGTIEIFTATISTKIGRVEIHSSEVWAVFEALETLELQPKITHVRFLNEGYMEVVAE